MGRAARLNELRRRQTLEAEQSSQTISAPETPSAQSSPQRILITAQDSRAEKFAALVSMVASPLTDDYTPFLRAPRFDQVPSFKDVVKANRKRQHRNRFAM